MAQSRALISIGVVAALAITTLAVPTRSGAAPQETKEVLASQGWTKMDPTGEYISQDANAVLIYNPYSGRLTLIHKSAEIVRVVETRRSAKKEEKSGG